MGKEVAMLSSLSPARLRIHSSSQRKHRNPFSYNLFHHFEAEGSPPYPPDFMPRLLGTQQRVPRQKMHSRHTSCRRQPSAKGRQPAPAFRGEYCGVNLRYHSDDESSTASNRLQASEGDIPSASALTKEPAIACPQPSADAQSTGGRGQLGAGSRMGHNAQVF